MPAGHWSEQVREKGTVCMSVVKKCVRVCVVGEKASQMEFAYTVHCQVHSRQIFIDRGHKINVCEKWFSVKGDQCWAYVVYSFGPTSFAKHCWRLENSSSGLTVWILQLWNAVWVYEGRSVFYVFCCIQHVYLNEHGPRWLGGTQGDILSYTEFCPYDSSKRFVFWIRAMFFG